MSNDPAATHSPATSRTTGTRRFRVTLLGLACVAFGLLIWSRLLLVTSYPKTAIAEPAPMQPAATPTADASAAD